METLRLIFDKNPGLLSILLTGVLLPLGILWLTNRHSRKQKETESSQEVKYNSRVNLRHQEKIIYASFSKILFDVQQLHTFLSGIVIDSDIISTSMKKFDESVAKYHGDISGNMLYLSSPAINLIYKFYTQLSEMKIEIREINLRKAFDMAPISVYYFSQLLASTAVDVQEIFVNERSDVKIQFDKTQQEMMQIFCGNPPSQMLKNKYDLLKQTINSN